ncbi:MAG: tRNA (adenosine(37)-N6)-threonylcarbamoyltransferase complex dimerization subunit type 1 TsaB [Candidatus Kapaibacteriales bacterium]
MEIQKDFTKPSPNSDTPLILGIESSGRVCSVALSVGNELLGEYSLFERNIHDEILAELINRLLNDCRIEIDNLNAVAISAGPGSFMGLRIGSAIAKGICFDSKIKLVPVGSLHSIAFSFLELAIKYQINEVSVVTHSHSNLYFRQKFDLINNTASEIELKEFDEILRECETIKFGLTTDRKICNLNSRFFYIQPSAEQICFLGYKFLLDGKFVSAESFVPEYHYEFIPKPIK